MESELTLNFPACINLFIEKTTSDSQASNTLESAKPNDTTGSEVNKSEVTAKGAATPLTPPDSSNKEASPSEGSLPSAAQTNGNLTSGNSTKEHGLPKAMIKPNVLTHVIEGFVIQEASEPFPLVSRQLYSDKENSDEPPSEYSYLFHLCTTKFSIVNVIFNEISLSS